MAAPAISADAPLGQTDSPIAAKQHADSTPQVLWPPTVRGPWRFTFAGYGWLPKINLKAKHDHRDATLPIDLRTIIDSLQYGGMMDLQVRKGNFGAYFEPIFVRLEDSERVQGPFQRHKVSVDDVAYLSDFGVTYEVGRWQLWSRPGWVFPTPAVTVEPFVGARWLIDDIKVKIRPGRTFKPDVKFIAPVLGVHTFWDLTDRLHLRIDGDYGGFDVDHLEQTYNLLGAVGWRFRPRRKLVVNAFAGYRYLYADYSKVAELEVTINGPIVGLSFEFSHE